MSIFDDSVAQLRDKYYNPGSHIQLNCVVRRRTETGLPQITWWKDGAILDLKKRDEIR